MSNQRIAFLNGTVAVAILRPDGLVFVEILSRFIVEPIPKDLAGLLAKFPTADVPPAPNPLIPLDAPESPSLLHAVLDLNPSAITYLTPDPLDGTRTFTVKIPCDPRSRILHPEFTEAQHFAFCEAESNRGSLGEFLDEFVPPATIIIGTAITAGALGAVGISALGSEEIGGLLATVAPTGTGPPPPDPRTTIAGVPTRTLAIAGAAAAVLVTAAIILI